MRTLFTEQDKRTIEAAVREAESRTSGEIVPVVVETSADYSFVGHRLGLLGLVLASVLALSLPHAQNLFWELSYVFALQAIGWFAGWLLGQLPAVIRLVGGSHRLAGEVHETALASFLHNGLHQTEGRTGVLVFVSCLERKVQILADEGIHAKVGDDYWKKEVERLARGLGQPDPARAFAATIREIGTKLAAHFPAQANDRNELPDGVRDR